MQIKASRRFGTSPVFTPTTEAKMKANRPCATARMEVAQGLQNELQARLAKAGVTVDEARLDPTSAYAPEIRAGDVAAATGRSGHRAHRRKIVQGAVSMVDMALKELSEKEVVAMDEERKAAMVSNLLVVLCGETEVAPVINTGTLYN